ncbi:shikimate kinase [Nocardia sp. ET3-3]|uniref:Shikimate kinase n=1 Tax=Nocardia terrae TaxID=2675851 RepID=A0A7K1UU24_9NOCA|nr:shikimate kinase [Nocardia terrae]
MLVGPPGAGKSTIGRKLARELGVDLYDTDAGIEERAGRTIPEIFAEDGEPEFRRMEEEVVRDAVLAGHGVVSLGGGSVLSAATRALLRDRTVVYLEISVGEGLRRTGASTNRPLLNGDDPARKYRELMKTRRPLYREVATVRVRTDGRSPGRVVRMILAKLGLEPIARPEDSTAEPTTVEPGISSSRSRARRKRRRGGGRGKAETQPATLTNTTAADPNPATPAENRESPAPAADTGEGPKRARRNRRSRRRGGRSTETGSPTSAVEMSTDPGRDTATTTTGPGDRSASSGSDAPGSSLSGGGRRRRASRAAGAPANAIAGSTGFESGSAAAQQDSGRSAAPQPRTGAAAQSDSARPAGPVAAPGSGRSRRARARRARARAREHETTRTADSTPTATPPATGGDS